MGQRILILACHLLLSFAHGIENNEVRDAKFSIFQIIKFPNDPCQGGTRNGTCFTKQECEDQGGTESGSCADGFGTCCSVVLELGGSSSLNQSYIVQASSSNVEAGQMQYRICPCSSDVCRIRFDFTQFMIAAPYTAEAGTPTTGDVAFAQGDCLTDTFSITGPQGGTPVICGTNEGQHMIVDTDGSSCVVVNFGIGAGTTNTQRQWDIMTTQYRCGDENGGPPGCLQWHMTSQGSVRSFNFPRQGRGTAVDDAVTHLSSQRYTICIRKPALANHICYWPCTKQGTLTDADSSMSFGLSISSADAKSAVGVTECSQDYIEIIGLTSEAIAQMGKKSDNNLLCGRNFNTATALDTEVTVCTSSVPFKIRVNFDENEFDPQQGNDVAKTDADATKGEFGTRPGGIIGFSLCYATASM